MPVAAIPVPDDLITVRASDVDVIIGRFFTAHDQFQTIGTKYFFSGYFHR